MATKKKKETVVEPISEMEEEMDVVAEKVATEDVSEPNTDTQAETSVSEKETEEEESATDKFIYTQLTVINKMSNPAKARRLADRVLRNKRKGK